MSDERDCIKVGDRMIFAVELLNDLPRDGSGPIAGGVIHPNCRTVCVKEIREYAGLKQMVLETLQDDVLVRACE